MSTETKEEAFKRIANEVMRTYHSELHEFLNEQPAGSLTDADVVIMIMNLTMSVGTNIYYSLKQILPTSTIDYDFAKAKIINSFVDTFEKIKEYNPKQETMPLTTDQVKEIVKNGFAMITMPDGKQRKVTKEDILIKKEDLDKIAAEKGKEIIGANTPKIVIPNNRSF